MPSSSTVEQIKSKIDIVTLVSSYMKLEKAGTNFKGKCPFHNEKTPSFFVSPDRGSYYCFGCSVKGDIFTFVQEFEGLDFLGSLKVLAERAGVVLERENRQEKSEKERLFGVLEQTAFFFQKKLSENPDALKYLESRGVLEETVKKFRIGFAPLTWRDLSDYLAGRGVSEKDMLDAGVIKMTDKGAAKHYDTFRGRIMFPIADSSGRVVGFSGRILIADENSPKYLNSPETALFNKSEILFGLDLAKKDIRQKDYSILVEGQMDLVMLHQSGIENTVASSGTALSAQHLIRLRRLSNRILMSYDGDDAGFKASARSAELALSLGMEVKIVSLPPGKDPADMALENREGFIGQLKSAKHIIDFYTDRLLAESIADKISSRDLMEQIRKNVLPYVLLIPNATEKADFIKSIARKTFIKDDALWDDLKRVGSSEVPKQPVSQSIGHSPPPLRVNAIERKIIGVSMWQRSKGIEAGETGFGEIEKRMRDVMGDRVEKLKEEFEKEKDVLLFETDTYYNTTTNLASDIRELLTALEEEYLKKEFAETMLLLQKAEQLRDSATILKYLEDCQRISQRINTLKHSHILFEKLNEKK